MQPPPVLVGQAFLPAVGLKRQAGMPAPPNPGTTDFARPAIIRGWAIAARTGPTAWPDSANSHWCFSGIAFANDTGRCERSGSVEGCVMCCALPLVCFLAALGTLFLVHARPRE